MEKRISQETFDGAVRENQEDFGLSLPDALADAIAQFRGQGVVNLDTIDITGGIGKKEVEDAVVMINNYVSGGDRATGISEEAVVSSINSLGPLCEEKHEFSRRNCNYVMTSGCYNSLHLLLDRRHSSSLLTADFQLLTIICKSSGMCNIYFR
jgi:hypothetical protein